jgi:hypothetical protein
MITLTSITSITKCNLAVFGTSSGAGKITINTVRYCFIGIIASYREAEIQQFVDRIGKKLGIDNLLGTLKA